MLAPRHFNSAAEGAARLEWMKAVESGVCVC